MPADRAGPPPSLRRRLGGSWAPPATSGVELLLEPGRRRLGLPGPEGGGELRHLLRQGVHLVSGQRPDRAGHAHHGSPRRPPSRFSGVPGDAIACGAVEFRWQPHVLSLLAELRSDHRRRWLLGKIADTLDTLEDELPVQTGTGQMWIIDVRDSDWVVIVANDDPGVLLVTYVGPGLR
jgi:hypothetical protein